ncbi:CHAT domain-containing protein [Microbacterium sp. BK668]|uniref:CHAT domain-containing protein n=1 Tax=Microbacterium sp. BK668 TaxID=2512118 RepID=UPI00141508C1|nr:CHAT domain-containing protein [Microbacterium sp. BK668]
MSSAVMELEIAPGTQPGSFVTRVLQSVGAGEPSESFQLDIDQLLARLSFLEASVLASAVAARRVMSDKETVLQDVGRRLFEAAFTGSVGTAYRTSAALAAERGEGLQVSLRLSAPGLAALPWEALYDPVTQRYICRKDPLVRSVPAPHAPPLEVTRPLRVLGMISSPRGLEPLDVATERDRLEEALQPHIADGRVELRWLDDLTWDGLHAKLLEEQWHVLHFIGHGAYDSATEEGVLAFVGRDGRADFAPASALADLLDEAEPTPRLVVLNSCQSGASGATDLFSGTAAALARSGIRAVAAMQFSISDPAALAFARGFYTALAHNRRVDEAVRSGRIGILGAGRGTLEWVTPVLYLRGDGNLFDLRPTSGQEHSSRTSPAALDPSHGGAEPPVAGERADAASDPARADEPTGTSNARPDVPTKPAATGSRARRRWLIVGATAVTAVVVGAGVLLAVAQGLFGGTDGGGPEDQASTFDLSVPLDTDWVEAGLYCMLGDELEIQASGRGWLDETRESEIDPDGLTTDATTDTRILPDVGTGAVIGRLEGTPDIFPIGTGTTYECPAQGDLLVGVNDTDLADNSGEFAIFITRNQ